MNRTNSCYTYYIRSSILSLALSLLYTLDINTECKLILMVKVTTDINFMRMRALDPPAPTRQMELGGIQGMHTLALNSEQRIKKDA